MRAQTENTIIQFLPSGEAIHILGLWEFVPYNDDTSHSVTDSFQIFVTQKRTALLEAPTEKQRIVALKDLKKAYDHHFGSTARNRNEISLFLYGGPVYASWKTTIFGGIPSMHLCNCCAWGFGSPSLRENRLKCSVLYPGDGYLDTPQRLNRLVRYINIERVRRVGVFQVMHHGARTNWHLGVAAQIQPVISLISSDPKRRPCHPHAEVSNEFRQYGLLQINKRWGLNATGWMQPRLP